MAVEYYSDDEYMAYFRGLETDGVFEFTGDPTFSTDYDWIIVKKSLVHLLKAWEKDNTCLEYHDFFYSSCSWRWSPFTGLFPEFHKYNYRVKKEAMINGVVYYDKYKAIEKINSLFPDEL